MTIKFRRRPLLIAILVLIVLTPLAIYLARNAGKTRAAWLNDSWANRIKLTIDKTKVGSANELFDIAHETNNLSEYTSSSTDGGNLSVSSAAALNGSGYGLSALINDANLLTAYKTMTTSSKIRYRFYFDPNSITMADADLTRIQGLVQDGGSIIGDIRLAYYTASGYQLLTQINGDSGGSVFSDSINISDAPHYIEVYIVRATNATSNDGTVEWWVDGVSQGSAASIDNYNLIADYNIRYNLAYLSGLDAGTSGTVYYDDFTANTDGSQIGPVLTDFPVYVDLSLLPASFHQHVNQTDGRDIRITKEDGITELPREVVYYNGATKKGELHFKYTGTLSSATDTKVYIYYGNPSAPDYAANATYGKNNVWDAHYMMVQHFGETSGAHGDSTVNGNNSTTVSVTAQGAEGGKMGRMDEFTKASSNKVWMNDAASLRPTDDMTVESWTKLKTLPSVLTEDATISFKAIVGGPSQSYNLWIASSDNKPRIYWFNTSSTLAAARYDTALTTDNWYYLAGVHDGATLRFYFNGSTAGTTTGAPTGTMYVTNPTELKNGGSSTSTQRLDGYLDELRISDMARSSVWLGTQYNNQNAPSTFFSNYATEESTRRPVLSFNFDEGYGTSVNDGSPRANNGTLAGATKPTWQTENMCITGKCLYFNGSTASVTVANTVNNIQSVSFWVKPKTTSESIIDLDGGSHKISASGGTITTTGFTSYYVNGRASASLTANVWQHIEATTATPFNATTITIGNISAAYLNGFIDEFKLYDYARTAAQVKTDAIRGSTSKGAVATFGDASTNALTQGLVGYWKLDETSGNAIDSSGNGNVGTWNGTGSHYPTGKFGNGGGFNGTDDDVEKSTFPALRTGNFTMSAWIKGNNFASGQQGIISNGSGASSTEFAVTIMATGYINFRTYNGSNRDFLGSTALQNNTWYHVTVVWEKDSKKSIYLNGVLDGSTTSNVDITGEDAGIRIGKYSNSNPFFFNGSVDEARVYNRALSPTEVGQLYNFAPGPVGYWKMDESTGSTINDSSGNGLSGTLTSANFASGKFGSALEIPNDNGHCAYVGDTTGSILDLTDSITVEAWIYPETTLSTYTRIADKDYRTAWYFGTRGSGSNNLSVWINNAERAFTSDNTIPISTWTHAVFTYDKNAGGTDEIKIYANGVLVGTGDYSTAIGTNDNNLDIGANYVCNNTAAGLKKIDDFKIYNYIRTPAQIVADMNAGHPAPGSPVGSAVTYWKFDEGYGTTANNTGNAGTALNGTITSGTWTPTGKFGKALTFTASTSVTTTITDPTYSNTISVWVYPTTSTASKKIVTTDKLTTDSSSRPIYGSCVGAALSLSTWTHIVAVSDGSGSCKIYQDGKETATGSTGVTFGTSISLGDSSFIGSMDEFKFYDFPITADQVKVEYNQGKAAVMGTDGGYCPPGTTCTAPVAEWKMDENTSTSANDSSGNGVTGTLGGGTPSYQPTWVGGKFGPGLSFDGSDDYITTTSNANLNFATNMTLEAWIYPTAGSGALITRQNGLGGTSTGYELHYDQTNQRLDLYRNGQDPTSTSSVITSNVWNHIAVVVNSNVATFYVNGISRGGGNFTLTANGTANTIIGAYASGSEHFPGRMDQVVAYDYVRTPAQIAWDYNKGAPVAWYKFDECTGTTANNSAPTASGADSGIDGTITPNSGRTVGTCSSGVSTELWNGGTAGKYNASLAFDGVGDYVSLGNQAFGDQSQYTSHSISAWIKTSANVDQTIFSQYNGGTCGALDFKITTPGGYLRWYDGVGASVTGVTPINNGAWHHVVGVADGTNTTLYIDGKLDIQGANLTWRSCPTVDVRIGGRISSGNPSTPFNGQIDDVRVYNYALNQTQVKTLYNQNFAVGFNQ